MIFKDYYKILGLKNNRVSQEEIKNAFREQAKKYHPDVNRNNATEERFKDINEAYKVLSEQHTKRKYDRMWNTHIGKKLAKQENGESIQNKGTVSSNFINMFFGIDKNEKNTEKLKEMKKNAIKGENVETEVNVTIEEAFYGSEKKIALRTINRKNENFFSKSSGRN